MKDQTHIRNAQAIRRLIEAYRNSGYRTTVSGRRVAWDEPGEQDDNPDVKRHNAFYAQQHQRKKEARDRLKKKGRVPTKAGKPIFEKVQPLTEDLNSGLRTLRGLYYSNKSMRFKEWLKAMAYLFDDLD